MEQAGFCIPTKSCLYSVKSRGNISFSALDVLKGRGLLREKNGEIKVTVATILLFGKLPTQYLPGARVRFLRYEGTAVQVRERFNLIKDVTLERALPLVLNEGRMLLGSQMREFQRLDRDGVFREKNQFADDPPARGSAGPFEQRDRFLHCQYGEMYGAALDRGDETVAPDHLAALEKPCGGRADRGACSVSERPYQVLHDSVSRCRCCKTLWGTVKRPGVPGRRELGLIVGENRPEELSRAGVL